MIGTAFEVYKTVDPALKDVVWCNTSVTILRRDWRPLVNAERALVNKEYLFSRQPMNKIRESFKDQEFLKCTPFYPLGIMESMKNTLVEEFTKAPPHAELRAVDPSAVNLKKADIELLRNRGIIQGDLTKYQKQVGIDMPYKVDKSNYNGNVEEFDKMGLDENDPDDINFFERNFHRLRTEISCQSVVNCVMKLNRFDEERIEDLVIDAMSYKTMCLQSYVDKITGEIKQRYIYPETAKGIFGDANDGHDDTCRGWEDNVTVMEWLQMVGDDFDWDTNWWQLLWAINFANGQKYTGFIRNNVVYNVFAGTGQIGLSMGLDPAIVQGVPGGGFFCDWSLAYNYKIYVGYIEWNTVEATATYLRQKGNPNYIENVPYGYDLEKKRQVKDYYKESFYQQQWYKCYFICTTAISQWVYDFGKVYFQQLEGANDEYASGTCCFYRKKGASAVEIAKPFIDLANYAFYRMLWVIHHAKPEEDQYLLNELVEISKGLQRIYPQTQGNTAVPSIDNILIQAIEFQRKNFVRIRAYPQIEGRTVGQLAPLDGKRNGVDPIAAVLQGVVMWAEQQIAMKIGINPMRTGGQPQPRQSYKSEVNAIENSYNSTGYMFRMIQYVKERVATTTLNFTLDIIKYKDSIPYNWLRTIVGSEVFDDLEALDAVALHRYGIFIRDYNSEIDRQEVKQAASIALQKGTLTQDQWFVITQTEDYKKANQILAFLERKKAKILRKQQIQDKQMEDKMADNAFQREMKLIDAKGQWDVKRAKVAKEGGVESAQIQGDSRIQVKQIQVDHEPEKIVQKTQGQKEIDTTRENLKAQGPFPSAAGG